ncbi:MAG TPA: hypothetical protein ENN69_06250, partial [Spirochaetia bacterium]|nr:hypothetical protein [Spirochaetia bacterium]
MGFTDWLKVKLVTRFFQPLLNLRTLPVSWRRLSGFRDASLSADRCHCTVTFANGVIQIEALTARILKIVTHFSSVKTKEGYDGSEFSYAVPPLPRLPLRCSRGNGRVSLAPETDEKTHLMVTIDTERLTLSVHETGGVMNLGSSVAAGTGNWVRSVTRIPGRPLFLGLGQKTGGLFKNGRRYVMWNTDNSDIKKYSDPLYQSCPLMIVLDEAGNAHGHFFDNSHYAVFNLAASGGHALEYTAERGPLVRYVLGGPDLENVCRQFTFLTGRYSLPPLWALGHHHSRWERNESAARILQVAKEFRTRRIPCDALHIDIAYLRGFRCFTWDRTRFPDPDAFLSELYRRRFQP